MLQTPRVHWTAMHGFLHVSHSYLPQVSLIKGGSLMLGVSLSNSLNIPNNPSILPNRPLYISNDLP